ncbi:MAG: rhodanese-like domain-containing protein [Pirellulales bacterium]
MAHSPRFEKLVSDVKSRVKQVSAEEARQLQLHGAVLVDVRESEEYQQGHAVGALPIGRGVLELKIEGAVPDPATPIICYCGGGSRSALAADNLQKMGYTNVASLATGFRGWKQAGLPTE